MATYCSVRAFAAVALTLAVVGTAFGGHQVQVNAASANQTKLAVVPGGPHPYFAPMPGAMAQAQKDFGIAQAAYKVPPAWTLNDQNQLIESLVSAGYNAFEIYPGDVNGTNATIAELSARGIPSALIGACTNLPSKAKFCIATDVYKAAYAATLDLVKILGGHGKIVHLTGLLADPNTKLRENAVQAAVATTHGAVTLVQTVAGIDSPQPAADAVHSLLAARGNSIDGIVATAYNDAVAAAEGLTDSKNTHIKLIAIDTDPIVIKAIKAGYAAGTMEQNPYGQAYLSAFALDQMVSHGCKIKSSAPWRIDSGTVLITKDNVTKLLAPVQVLTAQILKSLKTQYLTCS
jgi:ribose transport system substrate-binding protein